MFATLSKPQEADNAPRRLMIGPKVYNIPREAPFTDLSGRTDQAIALANRAQQANLNVDRRAINAPIVLGGAKIYEVTLLLRPGWLPHAELDNLLTVDDQKDAVDFWQEQFRDIYTDEPDRIPNSIYHTAHPDHAPVNTIGRY